MAARSTSALLGNPPAVLPPIEWDLSKLPRHLPRIAGTEAKWEEDGFQGGEGVRAEGHRRRRGADDAHLRGRARRVQGVCWSATTPASTCASALTARRIVIEVNPNPWLDCAAEFAMAARRGKPELSYGDMIEKHRRAGHGREIHERSAPPSELARGARTPDALAHQRSRSAHRRQRDRAARRAALRRARSRRPPVQTADLPHRRMGLSPKACR